MLNVFLLDLCGFYQYIAPREECSGSVPFPVLVEEIEIKKMGNQQTKQEKRRERREERRSQREAQLRAERRRRYLTFGGVAVAVVVVLAVSIIFYLSHPATTGAHSQAATSSINAQSKPTSSTSLALSPLALDNIDCNSKEQFTYHVHAHLSLYINGSPVTVPAYIGIDNNNQCFYWLHTHDVSGIIHIEAPQQGTYTLGTFFRLWDQRFSQLGYPQQLNQTADWKVYVNGKPYNGDFHNIALGAHMLITMAYNTPNAQPDTAYNWNGF
jgi:hypothetical protein